MVFAGDDEAELLGLAGDPADLARGLADLAAGHAVVKLGERGAVAAVDGQVHTVEPVPVQAVDPVGAGDAFVAGYLAETLAGRPVPERLATAAACGAFAVTVPGDWEGLPTRDELDRPRRPPRHRAPLIPERPRHGGPRYWPRPRGSTAAGSEAGCRRRRTRPGGPAGPRRGHRGLAGRARLGAARARAAPVRHLPWLDRLVRDAGRPDLAVLAPFVIAPSVAALTASTVGAVLASRRPRHPVGWLLLAHGLIMGSARRPSATCPTA